MWSEQVDSSCAPQSAPQGDRERSSADTITELTSAITCCGLPKNQSDRYSQPLKLLPLLVLSDFYSGRKKCHFMGKGTVELEGK
jgi:hypothetical protein